MTRSAERRLRSLLDPHSDHFGRSSPALPSRLSNSSPGDRTASSTSGPGPTGPRPTGRSSDSTAPSPPNGPGLDLGSRRARESRCLPPLTGVVAPVRVGRYVPSFGAPLPRPAFDPLIDLLDRPQWGSSDVTGRWWSLATADIGGPGVGVHPDPTGRLVAGELGGHAGCPVSAVMTGTRYPVRRIVSMCRT